MCFDHRRYLVTGRGFAEGSSREAVTNDGNSRPKEKEARHRYPCAMPSLVFIDRFYILYL